MRTAEAAAVDPRRRLNAVYAASSLDRFDSTPHPFTCGLRSSADDSRSVAL